MRLCDRHQVNIKQCYLWVHSLSVLIADADLLDYNFNWEIRIMKRYLFVLLALSFASVSAFAETYNVHRIYDGGNSYIAELNRTATAPTTGFSLSIDPAAQVATFNFVTIEGGVPTPASCQAGVGKLGYNNASTMDIYYQALELQYDLGLLESFYVHTGPANICVTILTTYRTDVKRVNVTCDNGTTTVGQSVYIAGSTARLGSWNTGGAVKLNPSFYPKWTGDVIVESNSTIQWKCLKRNEVNPSLNVVWQAGANNSFNSATTSAISAQF